MSSFKIFDISGSGMSAQSVRLNTVASNLANADSVSGDPATVYKARHPVFQAVQQKMLGASSTDNQSQAAVSVKGIVESKAAPQLRYDPGNPLANADGNIFAPNVNVIEEMTDKIGRAHV